MTVLQPDILTLMRTLLLSFSDVTDYVDQRIFVLQIPKNYTGDDCIVLADSPAIGGEPEAPITHLSIQVSSYSRDLQTSRDIERKSIFPNLHQYVNLVQNDGSGDFANDYSITILQSQSPITIQDNDYIPEYWRTVSEYDVFLRY